jgi:hypothetical protein
MANQGIWLTFDEPERHPSGGGLQRHRGIGADRLYRRRFHRSDSGPRNGPAGLGAMESRCIPPDPRALLVLQFHPLFVALFQ